MAQQFLHDTRDVSVGIAAERLQHPDGLGGQELVDHEDQLMPVDRIEQRARLSSQVGRFAAQEAPVLFRGR